MRVHRYSIRRKLTIAVVLIILSFLAINAVNYYHSIDTLTRKLADGRLKVLDETSQNVRQLFSGIHARASEIRFDVEVQKVLTVDFRKSGYEGYAANLQAQKVLQRIGLSWEYIKSIWVVPVGVQVRNKTTTSGFLNRQEVNDTDWYQAVDLESFSSDWYPTRMSEGTDEQAENIYTYVQPITNLYDNQEIIGHIFVNLRETSLYQILRSNAMEDGTRVFLLDGRNRVFYDSDREYGGAPSLYFDAETIRPESGSFTQGRGPDKQLVTYTTLPEYGWKLVSLTPYSLVTAELASYQRTMSVVIVVCAALLMVGVCILYRGISKPIRDITLRVEKIGAGDFTRGDPDEERRRQSNNELERVSGRLDRMAGQIAELLQRNTQIQAQKREAELKALQAQINPHFLYNTLDSINWLALLNKQPEISFMVTNLSSFYKTALNSGREMISIEAELAHARAFLEIEKRSYPDQFDMDFSLDTRLLKLYTIKLILQPLVENAVLHAFTDSTAKGQISVQLYREGGTVCFEVIDNGKGISQRQMDRILVQKTAGYGIANVDERIKLKFGEGYGVSLESRLGEGTVARIRVPVVESLEEPAGQ